MNNIELDILEAASRGAIAPGSQEGKVLMSKYHDPSDGERGTRELTIATEELVDEGYLHPYISRGAPQRGIYARGITFKGRRRRREIKYRPFLWALRNWFPLLIALIATGSPFLTKWLWGC